MFPTSDRDTQHPHPRHLKSVFQQWLHPGLLKTLKPRVDLMWVYQSSEGHQREGHWSTTCRKFHINTKELIVLFLFLRMVPSMWNSGMLPYGHPISPVHQLMGFTETASLPLHHRAVSPPHPLSCPESPPSIFQEWRMSGEMLVSRQKGSMVDLLLKPDVFAGTHLQVGSSGGGPPPDLGSPDGCGGPEIFTVKWNRWSFICLLKPLATKIILQVCLQLQVYWGVLLIAPRLEAQLCCT